VVAPGDISGLTNKLAIRKNGALQGGSTFRSRYKAALLSLHFFKHWLQVAALFAAI
jgi:hypothetical protein